MLSLSQPFAQGQDGSRAVRTILGAPDEVALEAQVGQSPRSRVATVGRPPRLDEIDEQASHAIVRVQTKMTDSLRLEGKRRRRRLGSRRMS